MTLSVRVEGLLDRTPKAGAAIDTPSLTDSDPTLRWEDDEALPKSRTRAAIHN